MTSTVRLDPHPHVAGGEVNVVDRGMDKAASYLPKAGTGVDTNAPQGTNCDTSTLGPHKH
jgi:hypothetical protein